MSFIRKHHVLLFFITWFVVNLMQASFTELFDDEAYYWMYAKFPAWGYFDHPPMIALVIKAGYFFFHNELGVRLFIVAMSTATLYIIFNLIPHRNTRLFYGISCSIALLQLGSILAVPDVPLAFFVALFFLVYRNFLVKKSMANTIILGVVMALMLYTKYHGILIIFFTFLSNPKLALKYQAYVAAILGAALFAPHLYWQYTHDFPSVQYHLFERNASAYEVWFTLEYLVGQLILPGPFMGWLLVGAAFCYSPKNRLERAMKFSLVGIYAFFFFSTFKGRVEANWTIPVFIPLLVLSHQWLQKKAAWRHRLMTFVPLTFVLVIIVRVFMVADVARPSFIAKDEFHKNKSWADSIKKQTGGRPVLFINSYQLASKYWFYAGVPAFSLNTPTYRRNNFNYWPIEDSINYKTIAAVSPYVPAYYTTNIQTPLGATGLLVVDSFHSFSKVQIRLPMKLEIVDGYVRQCQLLVTVPEAYLEIFQAAAWRSQKIEMNIVKDDSVTHRFDTGIILGQLKKPEQTITASWPVRLSKGRYKASFSLPTSLVVDPSLNSSVIKIIVE